MSTQQRRLLSLLFLVLFFEGCATSYPLGLKEEQWQALSPQQQAEYSAKQYQIDEMKKLFTTCYAQAEVFRLFQIRGAGYKPEPARERIIGYY